MDDSNNPNYSFLLDIYQMFLNASWRRELDKKGMPKINWPYNEAYDLFMHDLNNGTFNFTNSGKSKRNHKASILLRLEFILHFFDVDPQFICVDQICLLIQKYFDRVITNYANKVRKEEYDQIKRFKPESQFLSQEDDGKESSILDHYLHVRKTTRDEQDEFSRLLLMRFYHWLKRFPLHRKVVRFILKDEIDTYKLLMFIAGEDANRLKRELLRRKLIDYGGAITERFRKLKRPSEMELSKYFKSIQRKVYNILLLNRDKYSPEAIAFCLDEKLEVINEVLAQLLDMFCGFLEAEIDCCKNNWPEFSEAFIIQKFEKLFPDKFVSRKIRTIRKAREIDEYCRNKKAKSFRETG